MKTRTRYAPSPTGFFHVGGARTALFCYLYAKHNKGTFIVRIEDTDTSRNVAGGIESQLANLTWLGISPDESINNPGKHGPYLQSAKLAHYRTLANELLASKKAYRCFCSKEQLDKDRQIAEANHQTPKYNRRCLHLGDNEVDEKLANHEPFIIRLMVDDQKEYSWEDLVRGKITIPGSALTDCAIVKSNGIAMYNFAVVIDDYDMEISHVLRGEEHISNTPYQLAIKQALGFEKQQISYGHLPIIVNASGKKLSKRDTTLKQFISDYKSSGYPPMAIINFLALLGWSPTGKKEILNLQQLIEQFDLKRVSKAPAFFDVVKMDWIANQYFKKMEETTYLQLVTPFLNKLPKHLLDKQVEILLLFKNQISKAADINGLVEDIFHAFDITKRSAEVNVVLAEPTAIPVIQTFKSEIIGNVVWDEVSIKAIIQTVQTKLEVKGMQLFMPIRIAVSGQMHGPELTKLTYLLSKDTVVKNIDLLLKDLGA